MNDKTTGPTYKFDSKNSRILREYSFEEVFEEANLMVDYAELPAFSALPLCIREQLNDETIKKLQEYESRNNKKSHI